MTKLQQLRIDAGLTQKRLADDAGVKLSTLQKYEIGNRNIDGADLHTLTALASVLNVKVYDLLESPDLIQKVQKTT